MPAKRYLIVNADDFGLSAGVNRGVIEAHERGIVTSASLMVRPPAAAEAAADARAYPELSLGLHVDLGEWSYREGEWVAAGRARSYVNQRVGRVKRLFKFGVGEELVPAPVFHALHTVAGLLKGRTDAREAEGVQPVPAEIVEKTLPHLGPRVAAMVRPHIWPR